MVDCFSEAKILIAAIEEALLPGLRASVANAGNEFGNSHVAPTIFFGDDAKEAVTQAIDDVSWYINEKNSMIVSESSQYDPILAAEPASSIQPSLSNQAVIKKLEDIKDKYLKIIRDDCESLPRDRTLMHTIDDFDMEVEHLLIDTALLGLDECLRSKRG